MKYQGRLFQQGETDRTIVCALEMALNKSLVLRGS